ncbi:amidophosphoribosyltransferase [Paralimibaculum aggregatum]|uniref:Amidophosphoribosyltransferase n=1 Tax=Paralimibaculum aggregatum TaxID=3036245 RepID=A0ABQ6LCV0_9RHOB|nr:amidophosphoribosyltransferase [Limibaculum sp. NKW23]GMG81197.1 amidophosphoribosyltransferase [Limibaculum sp. NKW23]
MSGIGSGGPDTPCYGHDRHEIHGHGDPGHDHSGHAEPEHGETPFDDSLHEECGVFGVLGLDDASTYAALGLHALQHRGQEAAGIATWHPGTGFNVERRLGYVRDEFTKTEVIDKLPGRISLGHTRYSTAGHKGQTALRDIQPLLADFAMGSFAIAHNGNLTNADKLRAKLIERGAIFQSGSDTECILHLMARSMQQTIPDKMKDALRLVEGAFSLIGMTRTKMIGVRDPMGIRPLVLGRKDGAWILASETCALDIIGADFEREIEPGEMIIVSETGITSHRPFEPAPSRFCVFEYVYFSRPDSQIGGLSVYEARRLIGVELAREAPAEADLVCPIPDSGTPAAIGFSQESGIPFAMGIIRNPYVGRTFIEPTQQIRDMGVRLKLNVNRALVAGKRVVLVDDSVVRGTTSRKIKEMVLAAGAREVHFRIASPPTRWSCFYGVDTPDREKLLAARMDEAEMARHLGVDSLRFVSLDGLYRACGMAEGRDRSAPRFCDACFSGDYPVDPRDARAKGKIDGPVLDPAPV